MVDYHEPFVGGGSVLIAMLLSRKCVGTFYASDANADLITLYQTVQSRPEDLIEETLRVFERFDSLPEVERKDKSKKGVPKPSSEDEAMASKEAFYYWMRAEFNGTEGANAVVRRSALFLFLNKACFRGVYRIGPSGFNVPYGNYASLNFDAGNLRAVSMLVKDVQFTCRSFSESLEKVQKGDFVYLDPPYAGEKSFVGYTSGGFGDAEHNALFETMKGLQKRGVNAMISNADVPHVRKSFEDDEKYVVESILCNRAIHSKKPGTKAKEVLIRNYAR